MTKSGAVDPKGRRGFFSSSTWAPKKTGKTSSVWFLVFCAISGRQLPGSFYSMKRRMLQVLMNISYWRKKGFKIIMILVKQSHSMCFYIVSSFFWPFQHILHPAKYLIKIIIITKEPRNKTQWPPVIQSDFSLDFVLWITI